MRRKMSALLVLWLAGCAAPGGSPSKSDGCYYSNVAHKTTCPTKSSPWIDPNQMPGQPPRMPRHYDPTESTP